MSSSSSQPVRVGNVCVNVVVPVNTYPGLEVAVTVIVFPGPTVPDVSVYVTPVVDAR
jgi:hypothetical protein